jgi:voltage-gated potassium channel Kch
VEESTTSFMYFSLVTVTTLGYGDLSPVTDWARLLATTEAVIGQVYLVTVVAMLVGLFAQQRVGTGGVLSMPDMPDDDGQGTAD